MACRKFIFLLWVTVAVLLMILALNLYAAGEKRIKPASADIIVENSNDTTFYEFHITPDGIYGVDSQGNEWEYDLTRKQFETERGNSTMTIFGRRIEIPEIPEAPEIPDIEWFDDAEYYDSLSSEIEKEMSEKKREILLRSLEAKRLTGLKLGKVIVEEDETVIGPVFSIGEVIVRGIVEGDVISYKRITVTSTGKIIGNATAPEIVKMRGGRITGKRLEDFPTFNIPDVEIFIRDNSDLPMIVHLSILSGLLILGILVLLMASVPIKRLRTCLDTNFIKSFLLGFLFWIAVGPLMGLLSLTIIGIPVALLILPLAMLFGVIMGIIGMSYYSGTLLTKLFRMKTESRLVQFILGIIVLYIPWLIWAALFAEPDSTSQGFSVLFLVISIVIWSIGVSAGVGSIIITRFGTRDCKEGLSSKFSADATPPPPSPPPLRKDL
ncbi:MAG: polymer-forming cytoskeletal protein [Candidatus Zixiibacteriota bacterium]